LDYFDSGATDHISCSLSNLISSKQISPINVSLPDGTKVQATHLGVAKISESLYIRDVLFIPAFSYNLISISKLVSHSKYSIIFSTNTCVIQDKMSIKKIGIADLQSVLYILTGDKEVGCSLSSRICNSAVSQNIWHMGLGHPSRQRMAILNKRFSYGSRMRHVWNDSWIENDELVWI